VTNIQSCQTVTWLKIIKFPPKIFPAKSCQFVVLIEITSKLNRPAAGEIFFGLFLIVYSKLNHFFLCFISYLLVLYYILTIIPKRDILCHGRESAEIVNITILGSKS